MNTTAVVLYCTGRKAHAANPVTVYAYDGPVPPPDGWRVSAPSSVFELACDRARGGCGRSPRPSDAALRALIEAAAAMPGRMLDISYLDM